MHPDYDYLYALIDTPYVGWRPGVKIFDVDCPFWTKEGMLPMPEEVRATGCNCAGFLNLARRSVGHSAIGGTPHWWDANDTEVYDPKKVYPVGTLFLRPYFNPNDDGHLALMTPRGVMQSVPDGGIRLDKDPDMSWVIGVRALPEWL